MCLIMILEVDQVGFDYTLDAAFWLLSSVSFSLKPGAILHVRGENGSGKTTLLKLVAGLLQPLAGEVRFVGKRCYLGHQSGIRDELTVDENCR